MVSSYVFKTALSFLTFLSLLENTFFALKPPFIQSAKGCFVAQFLLSGLRNSDPTSPMSEVPILQPLVVQLRTPR